MDPSEEREFGGGKLQAGGIMDVGRNRENRLSI